MSNMETAIVRPAEIAIKAAIVKAGKSVVITLPIEFKALTEYEATTPSGIKLANQETKETLFVLATGKCGTGSFNKYGIVFDSEDEKGNAQLTIATSDSPKVFAKKYSEAVSMLNSLANYAVRGMTDWNSKVKSLEEAITVIA